MSGYNGSIPKPPQTPSSDVHSEKRKPRIPTNRDQPSSDNSNNRRKIVEPLAENSRGLDTIGGGGGGPPSTPGKNSTFSIPPPRRVPSTPGSEAPSEFRSMAGSSAFSTGVASSTFDPQVHNRALERLGRNKNSLGANPVNDMPVYYEEEEPEEVVSVPQVGIYDVFAPPGPIGIVVDTTKKGCIVHSLKKTSPMQGLIAPGDFILALDDVDVRKMDAASLTKLMAKKSQQAERKFTLAPAEY